MAQLAKYSNVVPAYNSEESSSNTEESEDSSADNSTDHDSDSESVQSTDQSEQSDTDSSDSETDPWSTLVNEVIDEHKEDMTERYRELLSDDMSRQEAYKQTCAEFMSEMNASFRDKYIDLLKRIRLLKKDTTYKKIDQTAKRLRLEDDMDQDEALEMAVKQRQVLLGRILKEWNIPLDSEDENDNNDEDIDD